MQVSFVLGSYNRKAFLKLTIDSIRREIEDYALNAEIIVVDGGSGDGSVEWLAKQKDIILIVQHNNGTWRGRKIEKKSWGYFMNLGFKSAGGDFICMVSDDCLIVPGAIKNALDTYDSEDQKDDIGAVAFYWRNWPQEKTYKVATTLGDNLCVNHGFYLKSALEEIGYIDENSFAFYHADGDIILKLKKAGYRCILGENSYVEHYNHANLLQKKINNKTQQRDWSTYLKKWYGIFYNHGDSFGRWMEKDFQDPHEISRLFKPLHLRIKIKNRIKSLFN